MENTDDSDTSPIKNDAANGVAALAKSTKRKSLDYLLQQAEVFAHFVTNGSKIKSKKRKTLLDSDQPAKLRKKNDGEAEASEGAESVLDESTDNVKTQFDKTPSYIVGEMRDYQIRALNWLITLYENGINGILADEMGLGKTLQTISMLGYLKHYEKSNGPHLIIAPNSTLQNWSNEIKRFCPSLKSVVLIGDKTARAETLEHMKQRKNWDVCVTSYEMVIREKGPLKRYSWKYVVIDEAHRIKNENSILSKELRKFTSENRLLLTGTPLQNNLHELWALLNYILPEVFSSADDFDNWFDSDNCLKGNNDIVKRLHTILRPFMLRRIKSEVEKSLLPKIELKLFVGLTALQRETYKKVLMKDIQTINAMGETSQKVLNMILVELRKAANHPYLIDGVEPGPPYTTDQHLVDSCGKMMVLDKLLAKLKSQGSRVVLFSQFIIVLNLLEDYLIWRGHKYCRLDGSTSFEDRGKYIDEFNAENSEKFIFMISTRAGGLGINLTTADTVIIYDSDWNPQADFQAIDRVHRIGQKKQVRVFRLVTENTVDERIVQRAEIKTRLDRMIIQQGRSVDRETLAEQKNMKRDMIRFGAEHILSENASDVMDIDIDKILKDGALKTAEENAKYAELGENELRNLTLEEASSVSVYQFEGVDFRSMQQKENGGDDEMYSFRQRKPVQYVLPVALASAQPPKPARNMRHLPDFQFHTAELLNMSDENDRWIDLATDTERKKALLSQGFPEWKRADLKLLCKAMERFGRNDLVNISKMLPHKTMEDITSYHTVFWSRGPSEMQDFERYIAPIKKAELLASKEKTISVALKWKMKYYTNPYDEVIIKRFTTKAMYTRQQDHFLLTELHKYGIESPDVYDRIRQEVLLSYKFRFDFFMRSRTANELKQRAKILLTAIQREYDEHQATKKTSKPQESSANNNKENDKESEKNRDKKTKRKSWMPTIKFVVPNGNESKAKNTVKTHESAASVNGTYSDAIASTSGLSKKLNPVRKMSLDMPILD